MDCRFVDGPFEYPPNLLYILSFSIPNPQQQSPHPSQRLRDARGCWFGEFSNDGVGGGVVPSSNDDSCIALCGFSKGLADSRGSPNEEGYR